MQNINNQPLVSVLMTVYNREKYIAEAIESVLASSYFNFELIIVDDRSTDKSLDIARNFEKKDERIKVYVNEKNLGDYPNRKKAAAYANGKYLKYLDSDDLIYWYGLQVMVEAMEKYPEAGIGMSSANYSHNGIYPVNIQSMDAIHHHFFKRGFLYSGPTGTIYNKEFLNKIGGFNAEYQVAADFEFNIRAALNAPVVLFQQDLFWWRTHEEQEINKHQNKYIALNHKIHEDLIFYNPKIPAQERKSIYRNYQTNYARKSFKALIKLNFFQFFYIRKVGKLKFTDFLFSLLPGFIRNLGL
jgi:glycosyltransferase involved in cell wall biosynthesis